MKVHFETRCDVLDPAIIPQIADICGMMAIGFESASYNTLRRMNKVRDRAHYQRYISNTVAIFKEAVKNEIPIVVFMIAGYPGDTEEDLKQTLAFAKKLARHKGPGGHIFKIGECRAYPKTRAYDFASSLPDVVFDDDGVFGDNIVRQPSKNLDFKTILAYMAEIFDLSNNTQKSQTTLQVIMPFFRFPANAFKDDLILDKCYVDKQTNIFNVCGENLSVFWKFSPELVEKYKEWISNHRST